MLRGYVAMRERMADVGRTLKKKDGATDPVVAGVIIMAFTAVTLVLVLPKLREAVVGAIDKVVESITTLTK